MVLAAIGLTVVATTISVTADPADQGQEHGGVCAGGTHHDIGDTVSGSWGTATGFFDHVKFTVNDGFTVRICVKGTNDNVTETFVGPAGPDAILFTPDASSGWPAQVSHWTLVVLDEPDVTTTTTTIRATTTTKPMPDAGGGSPSLVYVGIILAGLGIAFVRLARR